MTRKTLYILTFLSAFIFADISAQNSQVLYNMNLPQKHLLNPALRPGSSFYLGLPGISGINLNLNNNFVNFSDVFMNDSHSDSVISVFHPDYDINKFLSKIRDKNFITPQLSVQLFGLGFSAGESYIFLDINDRFEGNVVVPGDIFELMLKGNEGFAGRSIDLTSLRGDMKYFREIGVGFSKNFTNKLRLGIKGKYLAGIAAASLDNRSLGIDVGENYSHTLNADLDVNISAPVDVYINGNNNIDSIVFDDNRFESGSSLAGFIMGKKNRGFGLDIGATYDLTEKIVLSASLTDLGFIRWKKDVTRLHAESQFAFNGFDMTDVINGSKSFDDVAGEMKDSLKNSFMLDKSGDSFTTFLPLGMTLAGTYNLTNYFSLGLLSYSRIIGKQFREAMTMSANLNIRNLFSTSVSYTATNHRFDNIGFGLAFKPGIFQFYVISDRIPISWNRIITGSSENQGGSTIVLPATWNTFNLRLGMNLSFGNRIKKKNDKPMIIEEQPFSE